ncbi:RNA polymerase sigma factor [uncultured Polaribacter sp.]|uniref:RNA polymerase sigma factor n=1 Tax=uncultured Polaribacter sp. TaxID=174711 RepID=UPI00260C6DDF|nr:RNA polymerase sigma-70 factor [uncultured Polaribacter sp.]
MKKDFFNEENIVDHLIKGDESAYTYLVDLYYDRLCAYANNLARDNFESEDIVQNVIVRLWQRRKNLTATISIKNYLYRSVYNEFVDSFRKHTAVSALEKKYIEGLDTFYETKDPKDMLRLKVMIENEIEQLPPKCKETFLLSKRDGLTYTEIAEYRNVSVNTVENQMSKAFSILREKLKDRAQSFLFLLMNLGSRARGIK